MHGWALDRKADGIIKYSSHKYDFSKKYIGEYGDINYSDWDLIVMFPWFSYDQLPKPIDTTKIIAGVSSHRSIERTPNALEILKSNFVAVAPTCWSLEKIFRNKYRNVFYTPNGVDTEVFVDNETRTGRTNGFTFGWVGKESWGGKNYHSVIEPAAEGLNFVPILANKMQQDGVPVLNAEQMVNYYNSIHVVTCASSSEGAGNIFLEGPACGCMLMSTRVGHVADFGIPDYNYILVENNIESFRNGLERIVKMDINERKFITNNLQSTIRNAWSWNVMVENYINMFDKLL